MKPIANRNFDKNFMPIAIDVKGKKILIIGGGAVAWHKVESLIKYTDQIEIIGKEVSQQIKQSGLNYIEKEYEKSDLDGSLIVYAATNIRELNQQIKDDAHSLNLLVNVVDNPAECDFVSPAIYRRDFISVAVSSNAQSVYKAIEVRNFIKEKLEHDTTIFD
jgi:precorrin-2 dehydrogenase/sirohydrochlorin ferrochelatase